jgi:hypothetical protein
MKDVSFHELCDRWSSFVPPAVAASTWPRLLAIGGVLVVEAAGPFTAELEKRAPAILAGLPLVDGHRVTRIRFGHVPPVKATKSEVRPFGAPRRKGARKRGR